jgi:hypothetical protein
MRMTRYQDVLMHCMMFWFRLLLNTTNATVTKQKFFVYIMSLVSYYCENDNPVDHFNLIWDMEADYKKTD